MTQDKSSHRNPETALELASGRRFTKKYFDLLRQRKGESRKVANLEDELRKKENYIKELEEQNTNFKSQINGKQIVMSLEKAS